ncbi:MAG TPA: hypothetical protein VK759_09325 [Rhizomicrobium sp.]|jgi:hypothetical protein|nr:hypothetical protein [Rhizomicrobium sp.]
MSKPPKGWKPATLPGGPVTADYRRGIEDAAKLMEEWAAAATAERQAAYENAHFGILSVLPKS